MSKEPRRGLSGWLSDTALDHLREAADQPDLAGTPYEIVETLWRGGMGTVYLARDQDLDREVALKVVDTGSDLAERTVREARILARLEHPGIVPVHDVGTLSDGRVFYVMKRVRGRRLDELAPTLDLAERLRVFGRICEAVSFAHAHGVIHRDLKPENIMAGPFGEVLVMDWGVAQDGGLPDADGTILGTPGYMAPEQARGDVASIDERTDVWALGAILGFLLAGEERVARPLSAIRCRAMADAPVERYQTVEDLAADLFRYGSGLAVHAYRENLAERTVRFVRRYRVPILLILTYLLMRALLLVIFHR
ncbi:MAG TPA: serine/threonine-protein kinase [Thermoanaerobaculia bacterium]|nr:serine/threonine-protein kinase [Thermoanaerobaculia bacterium]